MGEWCDRLRVWRLRRSDKEYECPKLRALFRDKYQIEVGLYSYGAFDKWRVAGRTRIGRYCSIAKTARIIDSNHPTDALTSHPFLYEAKFGVVPRDLMDAAWLEISDDVWIGHNAIITPGCKAIGRGAIIGAGAVVTHDVPAYAIMAGVPAKRLRDRFDAATIAAIEASRWWERDKAGLAELVQRFPDAAYRPSPATLAKLG
ncbi:MAG: CatB-related O-acetyltransferase [Polymorphobacter sp.]